MGNVSEAVHDPGNMPFQVLSSIANCLNQPALGAALKISKDLQLFEKWSEKGAEAMTSGQLAEVIGGSCEPGLLCKNMHPSTKRPQAYE